MNEKTEKRKANETQNERGMKNSIMPMSSGISFDLHCTGWLNEK